ncbi:MAG: c-type cytochrome [Puia sp.]|nr:c-type cytochrome [Puia sp.]
MRFKRKIAVAGLLIVMVWICSAATTAATGRSPGKGSGGSGGNAEPGPYSNLRVLPADISSKDLQKIMIDDFEDGLGVACNFCHAPEKDSVHLDFASDAKPEKEIARAMMRMTLAVNKKFFSIRRPLLGDPSLGITCNTCHRGTVFPDRR